MKHVEVNGYKRITRLRAVKLFSRGETVYAVPSRLEPSVNTVIPFNKNKGLFLQIESSATNYHCSADRGNELWFYEKENDYSA